MTAGFNLSYKVIMKIMIMLAMRTMDSGDTFFLTHLKCQLSSLKCQIMR